MIRDAANSEVRRALRWRVVAVTLGVLLVAALLVASVSRSLPVGIMGLALSVPFTYAASWGTTMRIDLVGREAAAHTTRDVLGALPPSVRIASTRDGQARIRFPVDPKAAILQYHDIRLDWRRGENEVRIEADSPMIGLLSRTLLLRRADAWRSVIEEFKSRGYSAASS